MHGLRVPKLDIPRSLGIWELGQEVVHSRMGGFQHLRLMKTVEIKNQGCGQ